MGKMDELAVTECARCPKLVESRSRIVNGGGPEDADLLLVGEGPGAEEDERGEPFVGRSGSVLDEKLRRCGLDRSDVRIANCVRCRPPDNRDPHAEELANCRSHLEAEIDRVAPEIVVTLGKVPSEHLLERDVAVTQEAGTVERTEIGGRSRDVLVCVHPAAMLYDRSQEETLEGVLDQATTMVGAEKDGGERVEDSRSSSRGE